MHRETKSNVRELIVKEFREQVIHSSLSSVRVKGIIEALDISRNTFYYYFDNKFEVAMLIFRRDLSRTLSRNIPKNELVDAPVNGDENFCLPYYVHHEIGKRMLDSSSFMKSFAQCLLADKELYKKLFDSKEYEFLDSVVRLFKTPVSNDIDFILNGRSLPREDKEMLVSLVSRNIVLIEAYVLRHDQNAEELLDDQKNPFWNYLSESLHSAIEKHPIKKTVTKREGSSN